MQEVMLSIAELSVCCLVTTGLLFGSGRSLELSSVEGLVLSCCEKWETVEALEDWAYLEEGSHRDRLLKGILGPQSAPSSRPSIIIYLLHFHRPQSS